MYVNEDYIKAGYSIMCGHHSDFQQKNRTLIAKSICEYLLQVIITQIGHGIVSAATLSVSVKTNLSSTNELGANHLSINYNA